MNGRQSVLAAALIATVAMSSPATASGAAEGYRFGGAEFVQTEVLIKLVEYDSAEAVAQAAIDAGATLAPSAVGSGRLVRSNVEAWSRVREGYCEIHIVRQPVTSRRQILTPLFIHELAHCFYGRWHP